jgi:nitroreductase
MDALEAILSRRSIRKYKPTPIPENTVHELINAAMHAPSAGDKHPCHFVVVTSRKILDQIPSFHEYSNMVKEAPLAVFVCGDTQTENSSGMWIQDCSAATENLLIAANAKGLGSVWLGVYPLEGRINGCRKLLGLPDSVLPLCIVVIGHAGEHKPPVNRFNAGKLHWDKW